MSEAVAVGAADAVIPGPTLEEFEATRDVVGRVIDLTPMESSRSLAEPSV